MSLAHLFDQRIRGVRVIEAVALLLLVIVVCWVYLAKAGAGRERAQIASVERDIGQERRRVKLLRAEAAHLEQPARIEALSEGQLGLAPVAAAREAAPEGLVAIAQTGAKGGPQ